MPPVSYQGSVFVNCPFDQNYRSLFDALVFTVKVERPRVCCIGEHAATEALLAIRRASAS